MRIALAALLTVVVASGWGFVPAGLTAARAAIPKDEIVIGISQEPNTLFPGFSGLAVSGEVQLALFAAAVLRDDQWKLVPQAVREVPTLENGQWKLLPGGKMQLTWHLRLLRWQDGAPVDAEDYCSTPGLAWGCCADATRSHEGKPMFGK